MDIATPLFGIFWKRNKLWVYWVIWNRSTKETFRWQWGKNKKRTITVIPSNIHSAVVLATLRSKKTLRAEIWWSFYEIQISISSQNQKIRSKFARKYRDDDTNSWTMSSDLMRPILISTKLIEMPSLEKKAKIFLLTIV